MIALAITIGLFLMLEAFKPGTFRRFGYKLRYVKNLFYREALNKCPHCQQELTRTHEGRGICTNDGCGRR